MKICEDCGKEYQDYQELCPYCASEKYKVKINPHQKKKPVVKRTLIDKDSMSYKAGYNMSYTRNAIYHRDDVDKVKDDNFKQGYYDGLSENIAFCIVFIFVVGIILLAFFIFRLIYK